MLFRNNNNINHSLGVAHPNATQVQHNSPFQKQLNNFSTSTYASPFLHSTTPITSSQLSYSDHITNYEMLKQEYMTMNQKLNYVMNSIRTFWSPELKKERQLRKEEAMRTNALQQKLGQQAV